MRLRAEALSLSYDERVVTESLDVVIPDESFTVIVGPNACGKSTLLRALSRLLTPKADPSALEKQNSEERAKIMQLMRSSAEGIPRPPRHEGEPTIESIKAQRDYRLAVITAQREELLDARDHGIFDADVLAALLENLDASQITMEMRGRRS